MEGLGQIGDFMYSVQERSSAEHAFNLAKQNFPEDLASNLCLVLESPEEKKRAMAAVLLRKLLTDDFLQQLSPNLKSNVTTKLLLRLNEEDQEDIRRKLCLVVSVVASVYLPEWPEFWSFFCRSSDSSENRHLESALMILVKLSPETLIPNIQSIQLLFSNILVYKTDIEQFRPYAIQRLINMIKLLSDFPTEAHCLQLVLAKLIEDLTLDLKSTDRKQANEAISALTTLVSFDPKSLLPHLDEVISLLFDLSNGDDDDSDDDCYIQSTRMSSLSVLVNLTQLFPVKDPGILTGKLFPLIVKRLSIIDDKETDWCLVSASGSSDKKLLRDFATAMGAECIGPVAYSYLLHYADSSFWPEKFAAFSALACIAEVCRELLEEKLEEVMSIVLRESKHHHPWVRWASVDAIGELCLVFGSVLPQNHPEKLFQVLFDAIMDVDEAVQLHGLLVLNVLGKVCPSDVMVVYSDNLLEILLALLDEPPIPIMDVLPSVLEGLTSVIGCISKDQVQKHYQSVMKSLISLQAIEEFNDVLCLLSMVCITTIGLVTQSDRLKDEASELINEFKSVHGNLTENSPLKHQMDEAWLRYLLLIGEDFLPHMNHVVEYLLQSAQDQIDPNDDETEKLIDEGLLMFIHGESGESDAMEEQAKACERACEMLGFYAAILQEKFFPWVNKVAVVLVPLSKAGQEVRTRAALAMLELLRSAKVAVEKQGESMEELFTYISAFVQGLDEVGETELSESLKKAQE